MKGFAGNQVDKKIPINDLILLGIYLLEKEGKKCDFESLIEKCFKLSPALISFKNHKWPDSRKIDRPLRSLRKNSLIKTNPELLFSLTKKGAKKSLEIIKILYQGKLL